MANFCEYCGTKLENGIMCNCPDTVTEHQPVVTPSSHWETPPMPPSSTGRIAAPPPPPVGAPMQAAPPPPPIPSGMAPPPPPPSPIQQHAAPPPGQPVLRQAPPSMPAPPPMAVPPPMGQPPIGQPQMAQPSIYGQAPPQQQYYQQPIAQQPQLIKMCSQCNTVAPKNSGQFCTNCGGAYQMVPPPSYENGGFCPNQNCRLQVPAGSSKYCTHCGRAFNAALGVGGSSINMGNVNLGAVSDVAGKFGISMQRMIISAAAVIGILACIFKWYSLDSQLEMLIAYSGDNPLATVSTIAKVVMIIVFVIVIAICVLGDRLSPLDSGGKKKPVLMSIAGVIGLLIGGFTLFALNSNKQDSMGMMSISFWIYLGLAMIIAVVILPHVKQLERL